ncbi:MAG: hypothetical protein ACT4OJ_13560 [Bacteroidota bacterium]
MKRLIPFLFLCLSACKSKPAETPKKKLEIKAYNASESGDYRLAVQYYTKLIKDDSLNGYYYYGRLQQKAGWGG